ncbi:enoyl-CoA hydratase/3-hydroxyacyl-CoA dehydrogenase [Acrasis kona]|uniref:Enoyl-CoA hydratase/3-hydroxyacyl-CoA dehydrogenase n=1 Tax=Acrasis kona TaxID=1008807 RepID=A0AAW2YQ54_9EUKA
MGSKPVNAVSSHLKSSIEEKVSEANKDTNVKAIVLMSAIPGFFIAGADITEFKPKTKTEDPTTRLPSRLEGSTKPIVAAIDGFCLGGGLETAMGCTARVATPNSRLGLPELNLGIIPGWGGTQRLPRLIGVKKAMELMLTMKPISGKEAHDLKLVDQLCESNQLLSTAIQLALSIDMSKNIKSLHRQDRLESKAELEQIFAHLEKMVDPRQPQQRQALNAVKAGVTRGGDEGLVAEEEESFNVHKPTAKALQHLFFAERATSKIPNVPAYNKKINSVGVIGGGTMGGGIAIACLENGIKVTLKEVNQKFLDAGLERIKNTFKSKLERKRINQKQFDAALNNLTGTVSYEGFQTLDCVIEAVLEIVDLKKSVFKDLSKHCNKECILGTNTSTIDIESIASDLDCRDRIIGLHFFSPANVMPLLEIIRTSHTSNEIIAAGLQLSKQLRKTPVVVKNCVGFAVNRIFFPYGGAAGFLVDRGVHPYRIDKALKNFGFGVGPFRMSDIVGLDVGVMTSNSMKGAYSDRAYDGQLKQIMVDQKRLGDKVGRGYYVKGKPDEEGIADLIKASQNRANNPKPLKNQNEFTDADIQEILLLPVVNEACRVVQENLVYRVSDLDVASVMGMNFPRFRGGIVAWADVFLGAKKTFEKLDRLYQETGMEMFKPCEYLKKCADNNKSLESGL